MRVFLSALLGLLASRAPAAARFVDRCPEKTKPVRTADARLPWACALEGARYAKGIDCPEGYEPVTTTDRYDPFKCAVQGITLKIPRGICPPGHQSVPTADPGKDHDCEKVKKGFQAGPSCPRGTIPVPTPGGLKPFRCARREKASPALPQLEPDFGAPEEPEADKKSAPEKLVCPKGTRKVPMENPFEPFQCVSETVEKLKASDFIRFRKKDLLAFQYPKTWHLTDALDDEDIPSIYILADTGRDGRPVTMTVGLHKRDAPSFKPMEELMAQETQWHGAKRTGKGEVGGLPAVFLRAKNESRSAYLEIEDGYYVLSYSAPKELFFDFEQAFDWLLKTFRHSGGSQR